MSQMEQQIRESRTSLEKDIKALSELLARLGKETPKAGPWPPGSLAHLWDLSVRPSPGEGCLLALLSIASRILSLVVNCKHL